MANLNQHEHGNMNGQGAAANILNIQAQDNQLLEVGPQHLGAHHRPIVRRPRYTSTQKEYALRLLNQGFSYRQVAQATSQNCSRATPYRWKLEAAETRRRNRERMIVNCGHFLLKLVGILVVGWLVFCLVYYHPLELLLVIILCIEGVLCVVLLELIFQMVRGA